jgi:DNA-binding CsgD family transcriptional regulator
MTRYVDPIGPDMRRRVGRLIAELYQEPFGNLPLEDTLPSRLQHALGVDIAGTYAIEVREDGLRCVRTRFVGVDGFESAFINSINRASCHGALDWRRPPIEQRNRPVYLPVLHRITKLSSRGLRQLGLDRASWERLSAGITRVHALHCRYGIDAHRQFRTIICDGPVALGWVGIASEAEVPRSARVGFTQLIPAIQWRMTTERRLRIGEILSASLEAMLEHYSGAALVRSRSGLVLQANQAAATKLDLGALDLTQLDSVRLGDGLGELLLERTAHAAPDLKKISLRWNLTPRQGEVIKHVLDGYTNRTIATILGVSEATIEFHVTRIMDRAGVHSRAGLASEAWRILR